MNINYFQAKCTVPIQAVCLVLVVRVYKTRKEKRGTPRGTINETKGPEWFYRPLWLKTPQQERQFLRWCVCHKWYMNCRWRIEVKVMFAVVKQLELLQRKLILYLQFISIIYIICIISLSSYNGYKLNSHLTCFQWGFIAQLLEHHTGITEVMGSNPFCSELSLQLL